MHCVEFMDETMGENVGQEMKDLKGPKMGLGERALLVGQPRR